jgi:hypothetical protein
MNGGPLNLNPKERKPDTTKDQHCETGADRRQQQHQPVANFGRCFDDYAVLFNWHENSPSIFLPLANSLKIKLPNH